ncbi:hypothetical protein GCM10011577_25450 [Pseudarthrobacter polychromogenes]|uniref:Uncharacterized protein n=2 Tax=Pseudarthrobacter TaxID=1742993 RepID=A0ABQ1XQT6_9MICC|nr:hypothetical protein GCM10011577_25450 [Pseudarthrobacter polychromogenes]GGI91996.1 hypothetical protein GCM10007175_31790 [Pseudarthrobacter scleromae]
MAKAKAAPIWAVKTVVWVMKPGPMALVAIRNMAPRRAVRRAEELRFSFVLVSAMGPSNIKGDWSHSGRPD